MSIEIAQSIISKVKDQNLKFLNFSSMFLKTDEFVELLPSIREIKELKILYLYDNRLTDISVLKELKGLTTLDLRENLLTDISVLKELKELTTLNLNNNRLKDINVLKELKELTTLDLSRNQLTDISVLKELKELTTLDLSENLLTDINVLKELKELTTLNLSDNRLININILKELKELTTLNLSNNRLTDIDALGKLSNLKIIYIFGNKELVNILPDEVINSFNAKRIINHYFKVKGGKPVNEAKIVVVGEAEFGKTLLINRLVNDDYIETETTHGIIITEWEDVEVNDEKVKLNIWDFGGQKIMQNTHQYFFTERTIYILVLNARQNEASNKTREHLERIKSVAPKSPIIIVGNKIDQNKGEFDINKSELREEFNIKGFFGICSNKGADKEGLYDKSFAEFKESLIAEIGKLDGIHNLFRAEWFDIKDYLKSLKDRKEAFIKYHDYLTYCIKHKVEERIDQDEIVSFLNELGLVVYLQKTKSGVSISVDDKLIFNPEWLISGVYAVINNPKELKRRAILDFDTFKDILSKCKPEGYEYQPDDYKYVLNMMLACKLCVKMKNAENDYLIPDHLPEDKSKILKEYEAELNELDFKLNFHFQYAELFDDIFRRFLIGMYDDVYKEYYWKTGVVLQYNDCKALVAANRAENKIIIQIEGENPRKRQSFLAIIHREFRQIHKSYPNLNYSEWVAHKDHPQIIEPYNKLTSMEEKIRDHDQRTVYCMELGRFEHIDNFLDNMRIIESDKRQEKERDMKNGKNIYVYGGNNQFNDDRATGHQHNHASSAEIEKKLDAITVNFEERFNSIISNQDETKADYEKTISNLNSQIQSMLGEMLSTIGMGLDFLNDEDQRRFEELKRKPDWESNLTLVMPLLDKIGIKIETKTKFEDLSRKYRDQKELIKEKIRRSFGSDSENNE